MRAMIRALAAVIMAVIVGVLAGCSYYIPPQSGLPSRQNWLEGGGG